MNPFKLLVDEIIKLRDHDEKSTMILLVSLQAWTQITAENIWKDGLYTPYRNRIDGEHISFSGISLMSSNALDRIQKINKTKKYEQPKFTYEGVKYNLVASIYSEKHYITITVIIDHGLTGLKAVPMIFGQDLTNS